MNEYDQARQLLERAGYRVTSPPPPPPVNHCAMCGMTDNISRDEFGAPLIPVEVRVNEGEEGASYVTRWFCENDFEGLMEPLLKFGLGSHHHGSTTLLTDETKCGGYGVCTRYPDRASSGMEEIYHGFF